MTIIFDITEETINPNGQYLAVPNIEIETYWTNVFESTCSENTSEGGHLNITEQSDNIQARQAKQVIELYHQHGESEQFHSEYKTDLDMERLPSGKFATNALIMLLGMIAFNIVRICGQGSLTAISETEADE